MKKRGQGSSFHQTAINFGQKEIIIADDDNFKNYESSYYLGFSSLEAIGSSSSYLIEKIERKKPDKPKVYQQVKGQTESSKDNNR